MGVHRRVCGEFVFYPERSAVWPQCWLRAVCAVDRVGCCVGGGVSCGGKHLIIIHPTPVLVYRRCVTACRRRRWWRCSSVSRRPRSKSRRSDQPSPGVYFWPYPVFEVVGYGDIQRDTADTAGCSWIRPDTDGYSEIQRDTVDLMRNC